MIKITYLFFNLKEILLQKNHIHTQYLIDKCKFFLYRIKSTFLNIKSTFWAFNDFDKKLCFDFFTSICYTVSILLICLVLLDIFFKINDLIYSFFIFILF